MRELLEVMLKTILIAFLVVGAFAVSLAAVCLAVKWICVIMGYEYSRALAVALWVVLVALIGPAHFMED